MTNIKKTLRLATAAALFVVALGSTTALAQSLGFAAPANPVRSDLRAVTAWPANDR